MQKSLCRVAEQQLCSERSLTPVRLPSDFLEETIWIDFMCRACFRDAAAFVTSLAPGGRGCIRGLPGCGKTFLLATLAAFLTTQNRCKAVYLCGPFFRCMPLVVLQSNLGVAFGGEAAVVNEIMALKSRDRLVQWIKNRPEKLCFMLAIPDRTAEDKRAAMDLLKDITEGRVLGFCARAGASPDCGVANAFFDMPETFDGEELNWFARHAGKPPVDDSVRHLTGFSPLLLKFYYRGELPLVLTYYADGVDDALGPASAWALEALAALSLKAVS
ncbi:hypothetical protein SELMODRAFT_406266 [Selaginella moellendorffii]|uniref:Uncharacterized protein n=1 Tax=Selaginella moellendorffii TaxID=88036 RepID=D8R1T6_SELML|nr:hypothetical protein SELMODRAFT_406266 [Selaginella moellendorffii]